MQSDGNWGYLTARNYATPYAAHSRFPLLARFFGKFVFDVLPAALASVIGGFLFTQYHSGRTAPPPAEQMSPASAEVLALVRDEHEAIVGYLKAQMAAEKSRLDAQDADRARAVADAKVADENDAHQQAIAEIKLAAIAPARRPAPTAAVKVTLPRPKAANPQDTPVAAAQAQAAVALADQAPQQNTATPPDRLARDPDSLLAKTLDLKDQVVAATKQAVTALGDAFASVGESIGGTTPSPRPFSSDS